MKRVIGLLIAFGLIVTTLNAQATILVLNHGHLSHADTWHRSGVVQILEKNHWYGGGTLQATPWGIQIRPGPGQQSTNKIYLTELPSMAPLDIQANQMQAMLTLLNQRHPKEPIVLVGHSVGGVVARLALVKQYLPNVVALITIASPHLGTPRAEQALDATYDPWPIEVVKSFFGGSRYQTLKNSRGLYRDIVQPWPGSLLFWLNKQSHPKIHYFSVVRSRPFVLWGDALVPGTSQDMNNVQPLTGQSKRYVTVSSHELNPGDGMVLLNILKTL